MSAEQEKIIVDADAFDIQQVAPNAAERFFPRISRRFVGIDLNAVFRGVRQLRRIDHARFIARQPIEKHKYRRQLIDGETLPQ